MMLPRRTVADVLADLDRACDDVGPGGMAVASDGDGTLWTCDVGEMLFKHVLARGWVGAAAVAELRAEAARHGIIDGKPLASSDAHELVLSLWSAYLARRYPEDRVCEVMAWCMAGMPAEELDVACAALVANGTDAAPLRAQWVDESLAVLRWAARRAIPVFVVSASPTPVVEAAVRALANDQGLPIPQVLAMTPAVRDGRIAPSLVGVAPYGEGKREALARALAVAGRDVVVAALGDNSFDAPMLRTARIPLAVRPKRALLERASDIPGLIELIPD